MNKEEIRKRRQREYARRYYEEHKEELRKKKNDYRKNNLDKYKKNQKKYYQKNKDYYKNYSKEWSKQKQRELFDEIETLKQELQRKDNIIKSLISYLETQINDYKEMGYNQSKIREKDLWMTGQYDEDIFILDKIKELENEYK